ncbi:MAG: nucleoside kinase [Lachnospiraceae bacterium]|nr:nucleoside kinase [Lachnospiraceae bacterium]
MGNISFKAQGKEYSVPEGTRLIDIAKDFKDEFDEEIILASNGSRLLELSKEVIEGSEIEFLTPSSQSGRKTYVRGLILLMLTAFEKLYPERIQDVYIRYSLADGLYIDVGEEAFTEEMLKALEDKMREYVEKDIVINKRSISTRDAIKLFHNYKMHEKERLFKYRRVSYVNIYDLDGFEDYFYGYMPYSTGQLKNFDLELYKDGILMETKNFHIPDYAKKILRHDKFFGILKKSTDWGKLMKVQTIGALNDAIAGGNLKDLVLISEALQEKRIAEIANDIHERRKDLKFIMIAGPSSSGKTSFANRLGIQLRALGFSPRLISVDNYFKERLESPKDENGNYDFECLEAIDTELFNNHMTTLLNGGEIDVPVFDFVVGKKNYEGNYLKLQENDILIIEGIHCLNDKLSYSLPRESKYKIYISALTQINVDEHNRISTTDSRLIRRMVRDDRTRGINPAQTIKMWSNVRKGEEKYIFPYQEDADSMFNSALLYELAVLKPYAEPLLFGIPHDCPEYMEAKRLLKFLDYVIGVSSENIPKNSLMREFIGGSTFRV